MEYLINAARIRLLYTWEKVKLVPLLHKIQKSVPGGLKNADA